MEILVNTTNSKKDVVKAGNATTTVKELKGKKEKMTGCVVYTREQVDGETGEVKNIKATAIRLSDGEYASSISPTVYESVALILATFTPDEVAKGIDIIIKAKKSAKGREFFYIDLA